MNILVINPNHKTGGVQKFYDTLYLSLKKTNNQIDYLTPKESKTFSQYDVIHTSVLSPAILLQLLKYRNKVLFTLHGNYQSEAKNIFKKIIWNVYMKMIIKNITVPSNYLKKVTKTKGDVIPNFINLESIRYDSSNNKKPQKLILLEAQNFNIWDKCKNLPKLIKIVNKISANNDIELQIAGNGKYLNHFKNKYTSDNIKFLGYVTKMYQLIHDANIITNYSGLDNFPFYILESMAIGKPIIANSVGGIPELLGNAGILTKTQKKYKNKLVLLIKNKKLQSDLSNKALTRSKKFSDTVIVKKFLDKYHKIVNLNATDSFT